MKARLTKLCLGLALVPGLALAVAAPGLAATSTRPAPLPPPYAGVYQPQGVDEIGLWRESDEEERALGNSPLVVHDEALTAYLKSVLCAAVGEYRCKPIRVYVLRDPTFNATMAPNGVLRVFSGLLLRVRSEAELAAVLGHEFGHFEKRHSLAKFKTERRATDIVSWATVLAYMANTESAYRSFGDLELSIYGRLFRFDRNQEREADLVGLGFLNAGKLRPQAASRIWRSLIAEQQASAVSRGQKKPRFDRIAFFASHPPQAEREAYLAALADPAGALREEGEERYQQAVARWIPVFLDDQVKLNDFGASDFLIQRLAEAGWTASLWQMRGELFRRRGAPRDLANAADFYAKAIAIDPGLAAAHRGLGLSLIKIGRTADGRAALEHYLQLKPDASDSAMIGMTIASIGGTP